MEKEIEQIIKVAIEGNWRYKGEHTYTTYPDIKAPLVAIFTFDGIDFGITLEQALLDPLFWQAIGKVKGWEDYGYMDDLQRHRFTIGWAENMHTFINKIIEKDLDHAIDWLYNLIKE